MMAFRAKSFGENSIVHKNGARGYRSAADRALTDTAG
jgi:hypothetical protein